MITKIWNIVLLTSDATSTVNPRPDETAKNEDWPSEGDPIDGS